jgi:hypothetical protein
VLALAVYHFVADAEEPASGTASIYDHVAPGSYLAISHGSADDAPDRVGRVADLYAAAGIPLRPRSRAEITALFDRFALVGPGLVPARQWEPSARPAASRPAGWYAGLGRKTGP